MSITNLPPHEGACVFSTAAPCEGCGRRWDQDANAARNLLDRREERSGPPPVAGGALPQGACQILPPALVEKYLRRTGWDEPQLRRATFATFRRGLTWLDVPVSAEHFAYPERFRELLSTLSKIESRSVTAILADIG